MARSPTFITLALLCLLPWGNVPADTAAIISAASASASASAPAIADWFHIIRLDDSTYAISEPKYSQQNVSYLLIGKRSALLFDTGPGVYSIREVVDKLTRVPVLVLPSHLHFDHVGRIEEFSRIALVSTPALRQQAANGILSESTDQYFLPGKHMFRISRWLHSGETLDLGGRKVTVLSTPGHTPDSVSVLDSDRHRIFTGDLVNRLGTLANVPGSDIHQMAESTARIARLASAGTTIHEAHSERLMTAEEFKYASERVAQIAAGRGEWHPVCLSGVPAKEYGTNDWILELPTETGERLKPFASLTAEIDWQEKPCPAH
jgi:glyoxylase-like metal-dependent hydrolase (beta-lactamase superfamily II)